MRISIGSSATSLLAGAIATLSLQGAAWAGDGGEDLGGLNAFLKTLCPMVGLPTTSCPQLPTISQAVLEIAALENAPPEIIEALNNVAVGNHPGAGNPAQGGVSVLPSIEFPLTVATLPDLLSTLTPLAFISAPYGVGPATATQPNDPIADTFLYAVASGSGALVLHNLPAPDTLYLFYDDIQRTNRNLPQRAVVAEFSLPLMVLNSNNTERPVLTALQFRLPGAGSEPCSAAIVQGDFLGNGTTQTKNATDIGLNCAVVFAPTPSSADPHAIFQLQVPLLVTQATDPTYFYSLHSGVAGHLGPISLLIPTAFLIDATGFTPAAGILGPLGKSIGIAPSAGPLCSTSTCPMPPATPPTPAYSLCANLPRDHNNQAPVPAVAAFYAIATDGETHLLAPIVPSGPIVCPF
jgi:hypothetical protein